MPKDVDTYELNGILAKLALRFDKDTKIMIVDLDQWPTRMTLEALQTLDEKWTAIIQSAAVTGDEDIASDCANDLLMLHTLREGLEANAVAAFGPAIKDFSREPLAINVSAVPNGEHHPRSR